MAKKKAVGRPRAVEGEVMVVGNDLMATMLSPAAGGVYFLSTDDIIKAKGWATYREMRHDDQVKAAMEFKKVLVTGRKFELIPGEDTDEGKRQAKFAEEVLCRVDIKSALKESCTAFEYGYALAEQVFERGTWDEDGQQYVFLKKLAFRDPKDIELKMDMGGNFLGARQMYTQKGNIDLPAEKLWLYTHNKRFGNLYGDSDFRAAYRPWWAKKFIIQFWNVFLERFGAPMTKITYPQGASDELKQKLKAILSNLASKTEVLVPEGVMIELIEATRGGAAGYPEALSFMNSSIARAILMVALSGLNGDASRQTQGDSQSFLHLRILFKLADELSQGIARTLMEQVVRPLMDMNFEKPIYPEFVWQDYGQFEGMAVADEIRQLHAAGIIDMDQADVNYCRSILGLPIRDEDDKPDDVIRPQPMPPPADGTPPPAAPQGNNRADKGGKKTDPSRNK